MYNVHDNHIRSTQKYTKTTTPNDILLIKMTLNLGRPCLHKHGKHDTYYSNYDAYQRLYPQGSSFSMSGFATSSSYVHMSALRLCNHEFLASVISSTRSHVTCMERSVYGGCTKRKKLQATSSYKVHCKERSIAIMQ